MPVKTLSPSDTGVIILAAGRSSRMGDFKPLLPLGRSTVIEKIVSTYKDAGVGHIVAVVGYRAERLIPILDRMSVQWTINPRFHQEMFSSIKAGIQKLNRRAEAFFIHPADIPFVLPTTLLRLIHGFHPGTMDVLRPRCGNRHGHPPLLSSAMVPVLEASDGSGGLRTLFRSPDLRVRDVECEDPGVLFDLDTQDDFEAVAKCFDSQFQ